MFYDYQGREKGKSVAPLSKLDVNSLSSYLKSSSAMLMLL